MSTSEEEAREVELQAAVDDADDTFDAMVEKEESKLAENDPEPEPEPAEPFEVVLWFKQGWTYVFEVTQWVPAAPLPGQRIQHVDWKQEAAEQGDDLLTWIDWTEVVMVAVRSIVRKPAGRARRGK